MIKFSYKIKTSKSNPDQRYIYWECKWDGKHNEDWYEVDANEHLDTYYHPFSRTFEFKDDWVIYNKFLETFKKKKKKKVSIFLGKRNILGKPPLYSRKEVDKIFNPIHKRKISDVCAYNEATHSICKLLSDKKGLPKAAGNHTAYGYFQCLLGSLMLLWD